MDILGIGVPELVFILIIALIVLGPKDMQKAGKTVGTWMRKIVMSDEWRGIKNASRRLKTLPNELMREARLEELGNEMGVSEFGKHHNDKAKVTMPKNDFGAWSGTPVSTPAQENRIAPPARTQSAATSVDEEPAPTKSADAQSKTNPANPALEEPDNA